MKKYFASQIELARASYVILAYCPLAHIIENRNKIINFLGFEHSIDTARAKIGVGRIVKQTRIHRAVLSQMVDDQV